MAWPIIAGIWRVESIHATINGTTIVATGTSPHPSTASTLDGTTPGTAIIPDTDDGLLDGDPVWDRAVGPAQFLPTSWTALGQDGNGDGDGGSAERVRRRPRHRRPPLCLVTRRLHQPRPTSQAALARYNHDPDYVTTVDRSGSPTTPPTPSPKVTSPPTASTPSPSPTTPSPSTRSAASHHDYPAADLAVPEGTPVYAAHPGIITDVYEPCPTCTLRLGRHHHRADTHRYTYCHGTQLTVAARRRQSPPGS